MGKFVEIERQLETIETVLGEGWRERIRRGELGFCLRGKRRAVQGKANPKTITEGLENSPPSWRTSDRPYKQAWKPVR